MELFLFLAVVGGLGYTVYKIRERTIIFNDKTLEKYNFQPINLKHILIGASPLVIIFLGTLFDHNNRSILNTVLAVIIALAIIYYLHKYIKGKTNKGTALKATGILLVYGTIMVMLVVVVIILIVGATRDEDDRNYGSWYRDDYWW